MKTLDEMHEVLNRILAVLDESGCDKEERKRILTSVYIAHGFVGEDINAAFEVRDGTSLN
jgi:hypothetical protein